MQRKRKISSRFLAEDAPELDRNWFKHAALYEGEKLVRPAKRGRPVLAQPKKQVTLRLDADVVEKFRATGTGWQTRINDALKRSLQERPSKRSS